MNKVLVVVDYQNDFVNGTLGFKKAAELEDGIYNKVKEYLKNGYKVVFTYDTHYDDYLETREGKKLPVTHCMVGSKGHDLYGKLNEFRDVENTYHMNKRSFGISPEGMIDLKYKLGNDVDEIEMVGVVTNMCVISNVVTFQSQYINSKITVDTKLCASFDEKLHEAAIEVMRGMQINII